jgi:hypothetical protein
MLKGNLIGRIACTSQKHALFIKGKLAQTSVKAWKNMTEEPTNKESISIEKLSIDNLSDFQFHAAYLTYSSTFDKTTDPEIRKQLNQNITALQQNQMDYPTFYRNISQYRREEGSQRDYGRVLIKTQKKREWRRKTQKHERIQRHRR